MRLKELTSISGLAPSRLDTEITGITADSRQVMSGMLFIAIPGTKHDGRVFIDEAIKRGAAALVVPQGTGDLGGLPVIEVSNVRGATSAIASAFYSQQPENIAAITGTSGKTSTAQFTREMWQHLGFKSASIGTLGLITANEEQYGSLTTPDAITLHQQLDSCAKKGITHLAVEASSHGIALNRLDHVKIKAGGFTNLSRDHLDYHGTMDEYLAAKLRLFKTVMMPGTTAVINADSPVFETVALSALDHSVKVISYGQKSRDIRLISSDLRANGQVLKLDILGYRTEVFVPVLGTFQAWNGLCALGLAIACGAHVDQAAAALGKVTGVPGRLQFVGLSPKGGSVFVDYAHKPDALENVLTSIRPHVAAHPGAKMGVIFGCGGNRDTGKRPIMGEIAQRLADWVIVTDDNPRHEEPTAIRQAILAGCTASAELSEIGDRARAIAEGVATLGKDDVLIIAGKGHEHGQIVGDEVLPFDDADVAKKALGS